VPDKDWGINVFNSQGLTVANNTVAGTGTAEGLIMRDVSSADPTSGARVFNNVLNKLTADPQMFALEDYNLIAAGYRAGTHDLAGPVRYVDAAGGNFRLVAGGPGIDAGTSTDAPVLDRTGAARVDTANIPNTGGGSQPFYDMGAYEFTGTFTPPSGSYFDRVRGEAGLLSYWRLGEASGTSAFDSVGGRTGTLLNGVALGQPGAIAGDANTAAGFDGVNDQISLPALPTFVDFTVEGWQRIDPGAANNNALYGTSGTMRIMPRPGGIYAGVWIGGTEYVLQAVTTANTGIWVHWAVARSGATLRIFRNGVQVAVRTGLPAATAASLSGSIGRVSTLYPAKGLIDEVAVYSRALTATDLQAHYDLAGTAP
jgi:hypothetical protein